jgi:tetratricopeptide (TPR) repeat protein
VRAALAFVLAAAAAAHLVGLRNGFVYDDHRFVDGNPALLNAPVAALVLDPATHTTDRDRDVYRPLRVLGQAFDARRWGLEPFGFHLHSLLAQLACVAAGFGCLRFLLGEVPALLGATVLGTHPLGVEVVAWITSRGDLYALLFGLLALWAAIAADRRRGAGQTARLPLVGAGALAALAILGKESAVWVPLVVGAHAAWLSSRRRPWSAGVAATSIGAVAALALRQWALSGASPVQTAPHGGDLAAQAGWALYGAGRTLVHLVWPASLMLDYPQSSWGTGYAGWLRLPTLLALGATGTAWLLRRRAPAAAFLLVWMLLAYLPSSSLLVTLRSLLTDRAAYPMLLPAGALVGLALERRGRVAPWVGAGVAAALLAPLCALRTLDFESDLTLWRAELRQGPGSVQAHLGLAAVAEDPGEREAHLRAAVERAPAGSRQLGAALARLGDFVLRQRSDPAAALPLLEQALDVQRRTRDRLSPGSDEAATAAALAEALSWMGRGADAERVLGLALAEQPAFVELHAKRASLALWRWEHGEAGGLETARDAVRAGLAVAPRDPLLEALAAQIETAAR